MNLDQFIADLKRKTQYGNPATVNDQSAKDVLAAINSGLDRIAKNWLWDWLYEPITITLSPGVTDYTLDADIRKIVDIYAGNHSSLRNISIKEYHKYAKADGSLGESGEGDPGWYLYIGRDASGARKIRIGNIPSSGTTLAGFGKLKLTRFSESDLGTAKSLLPFPEEGEDVLAAFVLADIYRYQGKKELIFPQEASAEAKLKAWRGEEATEPANTATSALPDYLRRKMAARRGGYVV
jgi:hypothetical protein